MVLEKLGSKNLSSIWNTFQDKFHKYGEYIYIGILTLIIYFTSFHSFLLFHSVIELIGILLTFTIFLVFWNSRKAIDNNFFTFLAISFLFVGIIDLLHTLSYKGMNIFLEYDANLPTQLWIAGRFLQSITLFLSVLLVGRKFNNSFVWLILGTVTVVLLTLCFTGYFPDCYIEGSGLTTFKIVSEIVICVVYSFCFLIFYFKRSNFSKTMLNFIALAILFSILGEIFFSLYFDLTGTFINLGHLSRFISLFFFYKVTILVGIKNPIDLYFRNLQIEQKQRLQSLVENLPEGIIILDRENKIILQNPHINDFFQILSCQKDSKGKLISIENETISHFFDPTSKGSRFHEVSVERDYNRTFHISGFNIISKDDVGEKVLIIRDVTTEHELQEKVDLSSRLAALGELAQEITHDFNNIITTIQGAAEFAESLIENDDIRNILKLISRQALKGSEIIQQITDFTRQKEVKVETVNLKSITEEIVELIRSAIPTIITFEIKLRAIKIRISKIQYQQMIMNLLMNSKDALKEGGKIKLQITRVDHTQITDFERLEINSGKYAKISVEDNGKGMEAKTILRIFEPFFTTKPRGEGTGLGLAQVY